MASVVLFKKQLSINDYLVCNVIVRLHGEEKERDSEKAKRERVLKEEFLIKLGRARLMKERKKQGYTRLSCKL